MSAKEAQHTLTIEGATPTVERVRTWMTIVDILYVL